MRNNGWVWRSQEEKEDCGVGGRGWGTGMLQRNSQSASFKDIIEETAREDVERVWLGGGGEGWWGERKSIFYLQRWCGGNEEEWNSCHYGPLSFSASATEWSKNQMPWHTSHETRWGHICLMSGSAQPFNVHCSIPELIVSPRGTQKSTL